MDMVNSCNSGKDEDIASLALDYIARLKSAVTKGAESHGIVQNGRSKAVPPT